jgi:monolysocardiolipin acyltransferase
MSDYDRERRALDRWRPGERWYHPAMAAVVIRVSRFVMTRMNRLEIEGVERFDELMHREGRGLLTFSNHVSLFDDPLLVCNFGLPSYRDVRWVAADALNFFGSGPKSWLFTAGKAVPIVRGAGLQQPGFHFLADRLREGAWVHIFPEGGRTRDPAALMQPSFKPGIGRLVATAEPHVLPFYHYGMHEVLPVGATTPRRFKTVRVLVGDAVRFEGETPDEITARCHEALLALEARLHPARVAVSA